MKLFLILTNLLTLATANLEPSKCRSCSTAGARRCGSRDVQECLRTSEGLCWTLIMDCTYVGKCEYSG
jgi:hypothetical protein